MPIFERSLVCGRVSRGAHGRKYSKRLRLEELESRQLLAGVTLADYWDGLAKFVVDSNQIGFPGMHFISPARDTVAAEATDLAKTYYIKIGGGLVTSKSDLSGNPLKYDCNVAQLSCKPLEASSGSASCRS